MNRWFRLITPVALAGLLVAAVASPAHADVGDGHVDVFDINYDAATDKLDVKIQVHTGSTPAGLYEPSALPIDVEQSFTVPAGWDICATGTAWVLPQNPVSGLVFAGWNATDVPSGAVTGNLVTVNLVSVSGPTGSDGFCVYATSGGNVTKIYLDDDSSQILLDDDGSPSSFRVAAGAHVHANWTFDNPGTYTVTVNITGPGVTASGNHTYTFNV